jgi:hypothetical protein
MELKELKEIRVNGDRLTDKQLKHAAEHLDSAFVHLAQCANILIKILKHQSETRRKNDKSEEVK